MTRIAAQHAHAGGVLGEMGECLPARRTVRAPQKVQIEKVFERATAPGPRFQLAEVDVAQCKSGQTPKQRAGNVPRGEDEGSLVAGGAGPGDRVTPDEQKTREVFSVIFDVAHHNLRTI